MKRETARIYAGKEVLAQEGNDDRQRCQTRCEEHHQKCAPMVQSKCKKRAIRCAKAFEPRFEPALKPDQGIFARSISVDGFLVSEKVLRHGRNDGSREHVGCEHRKHHGFRKRQKQVLGDS